MEEIWLRTGPCRFRKRCRGFVEGRRVKGEFEEKEKRKR